MGFEMLTLTSATGVQRKREIANEKYKFPTKLT
jgi:hypothetical protein